MIDKKRFTIENMVICIPKKLIDGKSAFAVSKYIF